MRVKKLEIVGFKSFAKKTTILFESQDKKNSPRVIGIVGPNGCGKSNVVDALLWILGEQAYSELRGRSREDIIFNGTDIEPPHSFAEVSILLSLEPGEGERISPEYKDLSEAMMTRRIYRSGEGEFFLNKSPCRLQDISSFFRDTGAGGGCYSIISQGQIDSLIQSAPLEKRLLIEEASGIANFRLARKRAQNKLESTQENLSRINDIVKEVGDQLTSLRKYAERAKRYKMAREELRDIDLAIAAKAYTELKADKDKVDQELQVLTKEEEQSLSQVEENTKLIFQKEASLSEESQLHEENQKKLLESSMALEKKKGQLHFHTNHLDEISLQCEKVRTQYKNTHDKKEELQSQKDKIDKDLLEIKNQADVLTGVHSYNLGLKDIPTELQKNKEKVKLLQDKSVKEQVRLQTAESELKNLNEIKEGFFKNEDSLNNKLTNTQANLQKCDEHLEDLEKNIASQKQEYESLLNWREENIAEKNTLFQKLTNQEDTFKRYQQKLAETQMALKMLSRFQFDEQEYNESSYLFLHDLLEIPEAYENVASLALRGLLKGIVLENEEDVEKFLSAPSKPARFVLIPQSLKKEVQSDLFFSTLKEEEKLSFYIKAKKGYEKIKDFFLSQCFIAPDISTALKKWKQGIVLVTRDGYCISSEGIIYCDQSSQSNFLQQKRKYEEQITLLEQTTLTIQKEIQKMKQELKTLEESIEKEESRQGVLKEVLSSIAHEKHYAEEKRSHLEEQIKTIKEDQLKLVAEVEKTSHKIQEKEKNISLLQSSVQGTEKELRETHAILTALEQLKLNPDEQQKREKLNLMKEREQTLSNSLDFILRELKACEELLQEGSHMFEKFKEEQTTTQNSMEALQKEITSLSDECVSYQKRISAFIQEHRDKLQEIKLIKQKIKEDEQKLFNFKEQKHHLNLVLQEIDLKIKYCVDEIRENYVLEIETYYKQVSIDFKVTEYKQKQKALRSELRSIGEIPLSVISEYEEKQKRYDFLTAQRDDLDSSMKTLQKTIVKLDKLSKDRFFETFHAVNREFQKVFPVLFQGGSAKLILTDENDILESGVDILVRPPGKRLQNINLLSGGEKAMTAIGLIFALFMIRPSPFCVLDEVDAPLDDANTDRYLRLIQELSSRTQFVVITHNKRTMAEADILYGVTMEEPGISKIVGVQFTSPFVQNLKAPGAVPQLPA